MRREVTTLRRRVSTLEHEAEIACRLAAFDGGGTTRERIYRFIAAEAKNFPVTVLCRVTKVSRSAYYTWVSRPGGPTEAELAEAQLANQIFDIWRRSRRRYGVPRVTAKLWHEGTQVNEKRVARIMAQLGISGICGRRKVKTTRRDPTHELSPDLVERDFTADEPDELWVGDIERHEALPNPAVMKGHRRWLVAASH